MEKKKIDLIYPDLSYKIVGILFSVYNELGPGYQERYYQRAIANVLKNVGFKFVEQLRVPLRFRDAKIGCYYLDFLIDNKVILEIKKGDRFLKQNIEQVNAYLKSTGLKLAIIANFTKTGLQFKRIVNIKN
jgi:GxxExxY protein